MLTPNARRSPGYVTNVLYFYLQVLALHLVRLVVELREDGGERRAVACERVWVVWGWRSAQTCGVWPFHNLWRPLGAYCLTLPHWRLTRQQGQWWGCNWPGS